MSKYQAYSEYKDTNLWYLQPHVPDAWIDASKEIMALLQEVHS